MRFVRAYALVLTAGLLAAGCGPSVKSGRMTNDRMESLLRAETTKLSGADGMWEFEFQGVRILCLTDVRADRMRFMSPIEPADMLPAEEIKRLMEYNFDRTLDARYVIGKGTVYAAFLHPLSSLTDGEVRSALSQVANLSKSYGKSYSSGNLVFKGSNAP